MKTKQVKASAAQATQEVPPQNAANSSPQTKNLYVKVETFNVEGREVGTRIVDMYHFGTRNWLQNHHWWAMHNGHTVETRVATDDEVSAYLAAQKQLLADKFNKAA